MNTKNSLIEFRCILLHYQQFYDGKEALSCKNEELIPAMGMLRIGNVHCPFNCLLNCLLNSFHKTCISNRIFNVTYCFKAS